MNDKDLKKIGLYRNSFVLGQEKREVFGNFLIIIKIFLSIT